MQVAQKLLFQSTHPRGVRLAGSKAQTLLVEVSIHAPAWGATYWAARLAKVWKMFQSTHPRGVRLLRLDHPREAVAVSIHAPAWGATCCRSRCAAQYWASFNPRTRVGCDPRGREAGQAKKGFNPRTRVGCDAASPMKAGRMTPCFNPRTRVGCDVRDCASGTPETQFQSTHPRGVRPLAVTNLACRAMFQSTHPRGVRLFPCFIQ